MKDALQNLAIGVHFSLLCHKVYMGVIWFDFHVLQLLPIRFTHKKLCCVSKSTVKRLPKSRIGNQTPLISLWLLEMHFCLFLNWIHRSSQLCSLYRV